jgi:hypothetical protein
MDELRARLRRAEDDPRAARYLAGGADRDTAELRSELREFRTETQAEFAAVRTEMREYGSQNNAVLNAMREDLVDLREHVDRGFARADQNFLAVRGQLDGVAAFMQRLATRFLDGNGDDRPAR